MVHKAHVQTMMAAALLALVFYGSYVTGQEATGTYEDYDSFGDSSYDSLDVSSVEDACSAPRLAEQCFFCDKSGLSTLPCADVANDGECDLSCNSASCNWDGDDCFHGDNGCYTEPDGNDYRGTVSANLANETCATWSDPRLDEAYLRSFGKSASSFVPQNYPDAGLGGHNFCRNPDHGVGKCEDGADCRQPWCFHWANAKEKKLRWEYCDVGPSGIGPPSASCPGKPSYAARTPNPLVWSGHSAHAKGLVREHQYDYYALPVLADLKGLLVVLVPTSRGPAPRLFADFDVPNPTGHNASYEVTNSSGGVSELRMMRQMFGFCGNSASASGGDCTLHLGVMGQEAANYSLFVYDMQHPEENICSARCDWSSLGDGDCDMQCNNTACFFDRGDCSKDKSDDCPANCNPNYIGDGTLDIECFNLKCQWDGGDFGEEKGCADYCLPSKVGDGQCDAACNVASCGYDGADCFHDHFECYTRQKGTDYRGTVSHTKSGKQCQAWSETSPTTHTMSTRNFPTAGLGGHNFCRNPDRSETTPWCYLAEPQLDASGAPLDLAGNRFEVCDVGVALQACPPPPPSPSRMRHWPHSPPRPAPPPSPPPPEPCPALCAALANDGECDSACNSTVCFWDKGDCGDLLTHMLLTLSDEVGERSASRLKMLLSGDLRDAALQFGVALGMLGACAAICIAVWFKRQRRLRQIKQRSGSNNYTPYGESADATEHTSR